MLDDVLMNGFDQRIVGDGLDEDRAVVMTRCRGHIHLERQPHGPSGASVVDVLDGLEPRHSRIVDVMGFVVEDRKFVHLADDLAEICLAVGSLADRLGPERREEVVAQVIVFERRVGHVTEKDAMDVRQEDVARLSNDSDVVLDVERDLKIVAPIASVVTVGGQASDR